MPGLAVPTRRYLTPTRPMLLPVRMVRLLFQT